MKVSIAILLQFLAFGCLRAQDFTRFYQDSADLQVAMHLLKDGNGGFWLAGFKAATGENTKAFA